MRDLARSGASAGLVLVIMFGGSLLLWVGVPLAWIYVGGQVQGSTGSVGQALLVVLVGAPVTIILLAKGLAWLNHKHRELRAAAGRPNDRNALELVVAVSAVVAVVAFTFWFLIIAGPGPTLAPSQ